MIEKSIEANIIAAIEALNLTGLAVRGAWQSAAAGEVKSEESDTAPAALAVAVSPRSFERFGMSVASMEVALSLAIRADLCPTGTAIQLYADPIMALLTHWQMSLCCADDCGLAVDGFEPGGVQMSGGGVPEFNREAGIWSVSWTLSIRGAVQVSS